MPFYDIECEACGKVSEVLVKSDDHATCPACGCEKTRRLVSRPTAPAQSRALAAAARIAARREGHLSNF